MLVRKFKNVCNARVLHRRDDTRRQCYFEFHLDWQRAEDVACRGVFLQLVPHFLSSSISMVGTVGLCATLLKTSGYLGGPGA
jgi:hypothetical protein